MRKLLPIILISFSGIWLNAQTNLDSLYFVWLDKTQPATTRLEALNTYAWNSFGKSNPDSSIHFAQLAYDFALSRGLKNYMANAMRIQGRAYQNKGDHERAVNYFEKSLTAWEEVGNRKKTALINNDIAELYTQIGKASKALHFHHKSFKLKLENGDSIEAINSIFSIANLHRSSGNYPKSIEFNYEGLNLSESIGYKKGISGALTNICIINIERKDYDKANEFADRALILNQESNNKMGIARVHNLKGAISGYTGEHLKAIESQKLALVIYKELGKERSIGNMLTNIGFSYSELGEFNIALDYLNRGYEIRERQEDKTGLIFSCRFFTEFYLDQGKYQKALQWCEKGLNLAESINLYPVYENFYLLFYDTYKAMGNSEKALEYHEKMLIVKDSLSVEKTAQQEQQIKYARQALADSIAQVEADRILTEAHQKEVWQKNRTRNILAGGVLLALIFAGGYYSRWRYVRRSRDIISKEKDRSENLLLNILPAEIAEELKQKGRSDARDFDMVSILFTDFKEFTQTSEKLTAQELVSEINTCFETFDGIIEKYKVEKIKTIGDAYMAAGGLPVPTNDSIKNTVLAALEMQAFISKRKKESDAAGKPAFEMRVGIHTGPVVAGIVGVKKFQYDIWGDTVNTASRMESSGQVGQVNISEATYEMIKNEKEFCFNSRGKIEAKGKGEMKMYFVAKN